MTIIMSAEMSSWGNQFLSQINLLSVCLCVCVRVCLQWRFSISLDVLWKYAFVKSDRVYDNNEALQAS